MLSCRNYIIVYRTCHVTFYRLFWDPLNLLSQKNMFQISCLFWDQLKLLSQKNMFQILSLFWDQLKLLFQKKDMYQISLTVNRYWQIKSYWLIVTVMSIKLIHSAEIDSAPKWLSLGRSLSLVLWNPSLRCIVQRWVPCLSTRMIPGSTYSANE